MRVLLVGDHPPPYGGISVHVSNLAAALAGEGCEVRVLDVSRPAKRAEPPGVTAARGRLQVVRAVFTAATRGALVHVHVAGHNAASWSLVGAATWLSRPFGPSVVTVHSGLAPAYLSRASCRLRARLACGAASHILCASEDICRALRRCDVRSGRLEVLPAYVDPPGPAPAVPPSFAALGAHRDPVVVAAATDVTPEYGADLLVEVAERLHASHPRLGLCVVGRGADAVLGGRLARILGDGALVLGEIGHGETLAILAAADLFLRPTLADGDSLSVREALARGTPVVATAVCPRPAGALVAAPTPEALTAAVRQALASGRRSEARPAPSAHRRLLQLYGALLAPAPGLAAARLS